MHMEAGTPLGTVRHATRIMPGDLSIPDGRHSSANAPVKVLERTPERLARLLEQLNLPLDHSYPSFPTCLPWMTLN